MPRTLLLLIAMDALLAFAGCASPERQWMKVGQQYTVEEYRRDHAACLKNGKLDEDCMRSRGWVDLAPNVEKPPPPPGDYRRSGPGPPRY
jgi:hypothetical protein